MMHNKLLILFLLLLFSSGQSFAGDRFFIEAGFGSKYIDGGIEFQEDSYVYFTDFELNRDPLNESDLHSSVTSSSFLNWDNKFLMLINGSIGFRFSQNYSLVASFIYFDEKEGYKYSQGYSSDSTGVIAGGTINPPELNNRYKQYDFRLTQHIAFKNNFCLIAGGELIRLKVSYINDTGRPNNRAPDYIGSFSKNIFGFVGGLGYEFPLSQKSSLQFRGVYSFAGYKGNGMYYNDIEFNIGGFELSTSYRYDLF